ATGRDLAPRVAARLGVALAQDVTDVAVEGGAVTVIHPVYAGKALLKLKLTATPAIVALRPNVFTPVQRPKAGSAETVAVPAPTGRVVVTAIKPAAAGTLDVAEAPIVISGGRGLKEPANFKVLEELAAAFGGRAAVGASRAVVDAGWRPHADQVGQTGKTVSPTLYIAVGISGGAAGAGERMELDVVIVGAGPAGLATAIELAQLAKRDGTELNIGVLEKAGALGEHCLSGAVVNPRAFRELFPGLHDSDFPFRAPVRGEAVYLLTANRRLRLPTPPTMRNKGNYVASLCEIVRWLGEKAEALGVN